VCVCMQSVHLAPVTGAAAAAAAAAAAVAKQQKKWKCGRSLHSVATCIDSHAQ
jgi:hypothetical protein